MDVRTVPGVSNEDAEALARAGIANVHELRRADVETVASLSGLAARRVGELAEAARTARLLVDLPGVGNEEARRLLAAGVPDPETLAGEDAEAVSRRSGLAVELVQRYRAAARGEPMPPPPAPPTDGPTKVVLSPGNARLLVAGGWLGEVPILTAEGADGVDAALGRIDGDAVVLTPRSDEAVVRVRGEVYEGVPLYKERVVREGDQEVSEEVRVRVEEIRARGSPVAAQPEPRGLLGRLLGRRN